MCVDKMLVTYNTVRTSVQQKRSVHEASRTQTTQGDEMAESSGYAGIYIPFQGYHL